MTEAEKAAEQISKNIADLKAKIEAGATKDELNTELDAIKEAQKGLISKDEYFKLEEEVTGLKELVTELKEGKTENTMKKGELSEHFKKNAEGFDAKSKDRVGAEFTIKAPALMTTANITPVASGGFSPLFNNYIDTEVGRTPKPDNFVMNLVDVRFQAGTEAIYYSDRVNEEGDAEFIGEGALKPLVDAEYQSKKKDIKEVALRWKFTKRLLNHAPSIEADFREHATELIEQKMDDVALTGDEGVDATQFDGLATSAVPFVVPVSLADYYSQSNIYDVINAVATFVRLNNFKGGLTCVLNTVWKAKMQGIKNSEGDYIIPPFVTQDGNTVGEVRVEFQNKMPETHILLGDFMKYKIVIAENIEYDEGYENDDFSKNLVSRKLEAFMGSYIKDSDAGSIVYDNIATIQTLIDVDLV